MSSEIKIKNEDTDNLVKAWDKRMWAAREAGDKAYATCKAEFAAIESDYIRKYGYSAVRPMSAVMAEAQ